MCVCMHTNSIRVLNKDPVVHVRVITETPTNNPTPHALKIWGVFKMLEL